MTLIKGNHMRMSQDGLNRIVALLTKVLSRNSISSVMSISNPQYSSTYFHLFIEEAEKNNDALGYDDFSEELWARLGGDVKDYSKEENEFRCTWEAWVDLYRHLKRNDKLKQ